MSIVPDRTRYAHREIAGALAAGAALTNGTPVVQTVSTGGAKTGTLRFLATAGGTLAFAWMRPVGDTAYPTGNPANVAVTADTEAVVALTVAGHGILRVTFTPSANGTITHADVLFTD